MPWWTLAGSLGLGVAAWAGGPVVHAPARAGSAAVEAERLRLAIHPVTTSRRLSRALAAESTFVDAHAAFTAEELADGGEYQAPPPLLERPEVVGASPGPASGYVDVGAGAGGSPPRAAGALPARGGDPATTLGQ